MAVEPIAAISTAPGLGAVGIIRISGEGALAVARAVVPDLPSEPPTHRMLLRRVVDQENALLDQALICVMRGPRSFTGEDVVEIHCHGGTVHLRTVLDAVLAAGARPAEAGEFTRRAFLNGRLDLVQAEAIADLINARSEASCRLARRHLEGRLSRRITAMREALARSLVLVEAGIDFSAEEDVYNVDSEALSREIEVLCADIDALLATFDRGRVQRDGVRVVIAGRPNAGKSSLLNLLLEEDRAIVSPTPGTTRDYLDADFVIRGQLFRLVDTAGLRASEDAIEAEGVRRTRRLLEGADLVVYVVDGSRALPPDERDELTRTTTPTLLLQNKRDLPQRCQWPALPEVVLGPLPTQLNDNGGAPVLQGLLWEAAEGAGLVGSADDAAIARARHRDALVRARAHLATAGRSNAGALGDELIALDLRLALDALGEVVGAVSPDEILGRIFAEFCIGK